MTIEDLSLEAIAALTEPEPEPEQPKKEPKDTGAVIIFKMCIEDLGVIPFRGMDTGTLYARFPMQGHYKIAGLRSDEFKAWITGKNLHARKREANPGDVYSALQLMEALAWERPKKKTFVRWARVDGKIYLDLCDEEYRSVEIDEDGWRVVENAPAWFIRTSSMKPLPEPLPGGCLTQLREVVHLSDEDFVILCGWLVAACNPEGPFPLLALSAEAGSGKSFLTAVLKKIIDDDVSPKLAPFKDVDAIFAAAASHWVLAYDNLTKLTPEDSDHLCRVATGAGYSKRKLYTDNDEYTTSAARPVILNGITVPVTKMDLTDRSYFINLPHIPPEKRRTEKDLWRAFDKMRPHLLGAILTAVSCALRQKDYFPSNPPRMADAAEFTLQAEKGGGLPWPEGTFSAVLARMEAAKKDEAISEDAVASTLLDLSGNGGWEGSLKELLGLIHQGRTPEELRFLPGTPNILSRRIKEVIPFLRSKGVVVEKRKINSGQWLTVAFVPETKPQDFSAVDCRITSLSSQDRHSVKVDEYRKSDDSDDSDDKKGISSVRGLKKSSDTSDTPDMNPKVLNEKKLCDSGKTPSLSSPSSQKQQSEGLAECRYGDDRVTMPPVVTGESIREKFLRNSATGAFVDMVTGEIVPDHLINAGKKVLPGQAALQFDEEPPAPATPPKENPFLKIAEEDDDEPSTPRGEDRSGPPPGWLEFQSEEVRNWHAETLKRLNIIGIPNHEEAALYRTWGQFGRRR